MICPNCGQNIHDSSSLVEAGRDRDAYSYILHFDCPNCHCLIVQVVRGEHVDFSHAEFREWERFVVYPTNVVGRAVADEVPEAIASEYREASLVLPYSPKSSAALSRRCLQLVLREHYRVSPGLLVAEIQELVGRGVLPSDLADDLSAIRETGNFAAHPTKSKSTSEIVEVEPGEAEWMLDVLDALLDQAFVYPARRLERRARLNEKLVGAGKSPLPDGISKTEAPPG